MNNIFQKTITNEEIALLPLKAFEGNITLIDSIEKFQAIYPELRKESILGFDTETKPTFKKGESNLNKVSLLQLSTKDHAYLFRLNFTGLPKELAKILADRNIIKIGVAVREDIRGLQKLTPFIPESFIDLKDYVRYFGIENSGLKKLAAIILNIKISKSQQLSNWENPELSEPQQKYAATDAWACFEIYNTLRNSFNFDHD